MGWKRGWDFRTGSSMLSMSFQTSLKNSVRLIRSIRSLLFPSFFTTSCVTLRGQNYPIQESLEGNVFQISSNGTEGRGEVQKPNPGVTYTGLVGQNADLLVSFLARLAVVSAKLHNDIF